MGFLRRDPLSARGLRFSAADRRRGAAAVDTPGRKLTREQLELLARFEDARAGRRGGRS